MKNNLEDKIIIEKGTASLWRFNELLGCYAIVWPDEEPNLYSLLRQKSFTRKNDGTESGAYLYLCKQVLG